MNEKRMRKIKDKWKKHKNYLEKGILLPENLIDEETKNPSFSMMHSLSQGFSIMLFSATHKTKARRGMLHKPNAVRLVLGPDMVLIWHERTYHCGTRSRLTKNREQGDKGFHLSTMEADLSPSRRKSNVPRPYEHLQDMRLFAYVWNETGKLFRTRKDGRARSSDEIYQKEGYICDDFFKERGDPNNSIKCQECQRGTLVFDLSFLQSNQYANGEVILGDLEKYGWCVYRSNNISDIVESEIKNICARGTSWTRIHGKRLMKYAKCATYPQAWESPAIKKMWTDIKTNIFDKRLPTTNLAKANLAKAAKTAKTATAETANTNNDDDVDGLGYQQGRHNILKNDGVMPNDQAPHYDYHNP